MFVKYVTHPNATIASVKSDIVALITGNIASANDFGVNCNKNTTTVSGSYPANTYAAANSDNLAFTKKHNDYADQQYTFRIDTTGNNWISVTMANDYTPANNTFGNSYWIRGFPNNSSFPSPLVPQSTTAGVTIYFIVGAEVFHMDMPGYAGLNTKSVTLCDMSHSGLTRLYSNSMPFIGYINVANAMYNNFAGVVPRYPAANGYYFANTESGANLAFANTPPPAPPLSAANGSLLTIESPVYVYAANTGNSMHYVYGISRTSIRQVESYRTFTDTNNQTKVVLPVSSSYSLAINID